jgi:hypothetical protein
MEKIYVALIRKGIKLLMTFPNKFVQKSRNY